MRNRIWREVSLIVVAHALALGLAVSASLTSWKAISQLIKSSASIPELVSFRASLVSLGADLPVVVGLCLVVYVVLFQRMSSLVVRLAPFRLSYDQPAMWRAGKCIDELCQLRRWFKEVTAST